MLIKEHAVRRYRQRIGSKNTSKSRVIRSIQKEVKDRVIKRTRPNLEGKYFLHTKNITAVCVRNTVVTILPPIIFKENKEEASSVKEIQCV